MVPEEYNSSHQGKHGYKNKKQKYFIHTQKSEVDGNGEWRKAMNSQSPFLEIDFL